jgi:hypothetical protein
MASSVPEQYLTIADWLGQLPGWVPVADQFRIAAYAKYEEIYWASEEGFQEVLRGDNESPVFMPTARTIVNTVDRYTAPDFGWVVEPLVPETPDEEGVLLAQLAFEQLFVREAFLSKFASNKNKGIRRGDWLWHVVADDTKPLGKRIKILPVHPAAYFPVYESDLVETGDPEKIIKVHLAALVTINSQQKVNRLTYERLFDSAGNQTGIQVSQGIFDVQGWNGLAAPEAVIIPPKLLPPEIPAIPIYHMRNIDATERFGSSELRGDESALLGINQTMSDEDLTLAMDGLGIYTTSGGAPVDANGQTTDFVMGPGRVLTNVDNLERVNGTGSVTPYGDHYNRLYDAVKQAHGLSDVAIGRADSATAESGIALLLQLGPILAHTAIGDQHITDVHAQMFHDLCFWLQVYEEIPLLIQGENGTTTPRVRVQPVVGDKIPQNVKAVIEQVISLRSLIPPMISMQTGIEMLRAAGLPLADNELELLNNEAVLQQQADIAALGGTAAAVADTTATARTTTETVA